MTEKVLHGQQLSRLVTANSKRYALGVSTILEVKNLKSGFLTSRGEVIAVDDVSFSIEKGKTLGLVGESGCGKSVTSMSLMRLLPQGSGKIYQGQVLFSKTDLLRLTEKEMKKIRGKDIAMIFQDPMTALNPVFTCGHQIEEALQIHYSSWGKQKIRNRVLELLEMVGIPEPQKRSKEYPHQLSGGMRQRIVIAMALSCNPQLLIADEPTTALDVTIHAQILELIQNLQKELQLAMILITHDLGVVAEVCNDVAVMYAGKIVETASVEDIFSSPQHPYTQGLLNSVPHFESGTRLKKLNSIPGTVPSLFQLPSGCRFEARCPNSFEPCKKSYPQFDGRKACHLKHEDVARP